MALDAAEKRAHVFLILWGFALGIAANLIGHILWEMFLRKRIIGA